MIYLLTAIVIILAAALVFVLLMLSRQNRRARREETLTMASDLLDKYTRTLREENARQMQAVLNPLAQNISDFRKAVSDCYVSENATRRSLSDQIDRLMKLNESIGTEARNLTSALKGDSKIQGDWGEQILQTMLEQAGLQEGIHFKTQVSRDDLGGKLLADNGRGQRLDVLVYLPENRKIIIDSKTSLTAYADLCAARDESGRREATARHLRSVRKHIDELTAKGYSRSLKEAADQVLMFIPNEGAYIAAIHADPDLWRYAYDRGIILVSPTHLFSVMHIVQQIWKQEAQNQNTLRIAEKGAALYDKLAGFLESMEEVGRSLEKARTSYDTALKRLATGRGNALRLSEELRELGVKATKRMPPSTARLLSEEEPEVPQK